MRKERCSNPTKSTHHPVALNSTFSRIDSTEKAPGMFGTLVICLPSEYEGGAVVASHRGVSQVFEAACAFDYSYIAW